MDRDTLLDRFAAEYLAPRSISPARRAESMRILKALADRLDHPLDGLTAADVATFVGTQLATGLHPNTVRKQLGMVRAFVTWASEARIIDTARTAELQSVSNPRGSTTKTRPRPYKVSEIAELRRQLVEKYPPLPEYGKGSHALRRFLRRQNRRHKLYGPLWRHARRLQYEAQIALALEQGLRRVEIFRLTIPAMHPDNDEVVVLTAKQGPGSHVTRSVPYTTHARNVAQEWLDFRWLLHPPHESPWLNLSLSFPLDRQLAPMKPDQFAHALDALGGWEWHRLRHTAATEWLRSGVPLDKVRLFMGHSSIEQTLAYAEIVGRDISQAFGNAEADFAKRLGLAA